MAFTAPGRPAQVPVNAGARELQALRLLLDGISDQGLVLLGPDGRIQSWNSGAEHLLGHAQADILGQPFACLFSGEDGLRGRPAALLERASGQRIAEIGWHVHKSGRQVVLRLVLGAIRGAGASAGAGVIEGYSLVLQEVSGALREVPPSTLFQGVVEGMTDFAVMRLDTGGLVQAWNSGAEHMFGYPAAVVRGQSCARLYTAEDSAAGRAEAAVQRAGLDGRMEEEGWRRRHDGSRFWARDVMTVLRDGDGGVRGFVRVLQDLTDRQAEVHELRVLNGRLETLAREQVTELALERRRRTSLESQLRMEMDRMRAIAATLVKL